MNELRFGGGSGSGHGSGTRVERYPGCRNAEAEAAMEAAQESIVIPDGDLMRLGAKNFCCLLQNGEIEKWGRGRGSGKPLLIP